MIMFQEITASKNSIANRNLVFGVGINDANYVTQPGTHNKQSKCPYYSIWKDMLKRCYSSKYLLKRPTYKGCTCLLYTSPSPRDRTRSRMPSSA